jgi:opacity protein-like surface antigen
VLFAFRPRQVIPIRRTKPDREAAIAAPIRERIARLRRRRPRGAAVMIRKILVLGIFLAASLGQAARAADLDEMPPPVNVPQDDVSSLFGTGWYIRGDIGYSVPQGPSGTYANTPLTQVSWANSATVGAGVGMKINNWFRADLTGDYLFQRDVHYFGTDPASNQLFRNSTELGGYNVLANAYFDIGTWSGVTPYIGAGAGYAFLRNSQIKSVPIVQNPGGGFGPLIDPNTGGAIVNYSGGGSRGSFAWALMAGASVDLGLGLKFDLGYRYYNVTDGALAGGATGTTKLKSLGVNQFRFGLRYSFDQ